MRGSLVKRHFIGTIEGMGEVTSLESESLLDLSLPNAYPVLVI